MAFRQSTLTKMEMRVKITMKGQQKFKKKINENKKGQYK